MAPASTYDVLIVGAGPAGSAAAWALARAGVRVGLVDRQPFPRDKVCGDALIPDALGALETMGLRSTIEAGAARLRELRVFVPSGRYVSLTAEFACVPRLHLDWALVEAAVGAGAELVEGMTAVAPRLDGGRVAGVTFTSGGSSVVVDARLTFLATGANATTLSAFGLAPPTTADAVAGRAYFQVPDDLAARFQHLCIAFDRPLCPGYGWIFPGPGNRFNLGVGMVGRRAGAPRLRDLWRRFLATFGAAAEIVRRSVPLTEFRGAPLRTGLAGARFGRPGLLALGEAVAMTYPATGEGIGKAMESGLLAADLAGQALAGHGQLEDVHRAYESEFRRRFEPRYRAYRVAEAWLSRPWLLNLLARRAEAGCFVRTELEGLVSERGDPRHLFSATGLATALFR
jgi:geranylgeranyl reductase family protein